MAYLIIGKYHGKSEVIDSTDDEKDAKYLQGEYRMAYGTGWDISIVKGRDCDCEKE